MPGHVGTDIIANTRLAHGTPAAHELSDADVEEHFPPDVRSSLVDAGLLAAGASHDDVRAFLARIESDFRDKAPVTAGEAATLILDGVRSGAWRILIGEGAEKLDEAIRAYPELAYDYAELAKRVAPEATSRSPST